MSSFHTLLLLVLTTLCFTVHAVPTISVEGSKFFTSDGDQFFIKGQRSTSRGPLLD